MELQEAIIVTGDIMEDFKSRLAQLCEDFQAEITARDSKMFVKITDLKSHHSGHQKVSFEFPLGKTFYMYQEK